MTQLPSSRVYVAGEVAVLLDCSEETFLKKLPELEQSFSFPRRIPGFRKWPRIAIHHWIDTSAGTYALPSGLIADGDAEIDELVAELEREYVSAPQLQQVA